MATAEIISIGTELLLGHVLDTNSQFVSTELANIGIDCLFRSTVGDNIDRIIGAFRQALNRSDIVISTGGLGPTADDLTHACLAQLFQVEMDFDEGVLLRIKDFFQCRGVHMVESNQKQAYRPHGSEILPNPLGTAPGIIWTLEEEVLKRVRIADPERTRYILTFPGVPTEMKKMWSDGARPFLADKTESCVLWSQELKHYGIGESTLAEQYAHLLSGANPTVAPLAGVGECRLRVSAKATSVEEAKTLARPIIEEIKTGSGQNCYGVDNDTLESVVGKLLKDKGLTIAAAESCTGGLFSKRLTDIEGSSAYVRLNVVTYADEAKRNLLGVSQELLEKYGAVSAECARAMAIGVRQLVTADIGIGITGIAGPDGGSAEKPVGLVFIGLADSAQRVKVVTCRFSEQLGRNGIRHRSASEALNLLRLHLLGANQPGDSRLDSKKDSKQYDTKKVEPKPEPRQGDRQNTASQATTPSEVKQGDMDLADCRKDSTEGGETASRKPDQSGQPHDQVRFRSRTVGA